MPTTIFLLALLFPVGRVIDSELKFMKKIYDIVYTTSSCLSEKQRGLHCIQLCGAKSYIGSIWEKDKIKK